MFVCFLAPTIRTVYYKQDTLVAQCLFVFRLEWFHYFYTLADGNCMFMKAHHSILRTYIGLTYIWAHRGHVHVKDSLTHRPSSQGWAPECPLGSIFIPASCMVPGLQLPSSLPSVLCTCTCISMIFRVW